MPALLERLQGLSPIIAQICKISGTPGVSIGVLHEGQVLYTHNHGYRDVEQKLEPDDRTIYFLGSLTKSFTAASMGILVEEGKLTWDAPMREVLSQFHHKDNTIEETATVLDFLSHRSGLAPKNMLWLHERAGVEFPRSETFNVVSYLEMVYPLRERWLYNNWGYALADQIIQRLSKNETWGDFLMERILKPLGLTRTQTKQSPKTENVAEAYMALSDGSPYHLPKPSVQDGVIMEGAGGLQSSVVDLLKYSQEFLRALDDQLAKNETSTPGSPLKQLKTISQGHINLSPESSSLERAYALGWIRTQLPGPLGTVGLNPMYVDAMPLVGKGLKDNPLVYHHQGSLIDFSSSLHLIPSSQTAIVVLTNSIGLNDGADWLGQLLVETVLDNSDPNDYVELAKRSAQASNKLWDQMTAELERTRTPGGSTRPLKAYDGEYYNVINDWHMEIWTEGEQIYMCHQSDRKQWYYLTHHNNDSFSWLITRNEAARRGRFPVTDLSFYLLEFGGGEDGRIDHVIWKHDPTVPEGEKFYRHRLEDNPDKPFELVPDKGAGQTRLGAIEKR